MAEETAKLMSETGVSLDPAGQRLLAIEIAQFPAADRDRAAGALALASLLHAADRQQREPYASHYADLRIMPICRQERLVVAA